VKFISNSFLLILLISAATFSQDKIDFERYSLEDGLSQSVVLDIVQDSKGFIWVATQDGLNRFDGYL
jgi:ligand-binding sensor domain-containing protein